MGQLDSLDESNSGPQKYPHQRVKLTQSFFSVQHSYLWSLDRVISFVFTVLGKYFVMFISFYFPTFLFFFALFLRFYFVIFSL